MVRICFYGHLAAAMISVVVTRFEVFFSNRMWETVVVLPLLATACVGPCATILAALLTRERKATDLLAVVGSVLLSGLQYIIWLPTVQ